MQKTTKEPKNHKRKNIFSKHEKKIIKKYKKDLKHKPKEKKKFPKPQEKIKEIFLYEESLDSLICQNEIKIIVNEDKNRLMLKLNPENDEIEEQEKDENVKIKEKVEEDENKKVDEDKKEVDEAVKIKEIENDDKKDEIKKDVFNNPFNEKNVFWEKRKKKRDYDDYIISWNYKKIKYK
jgi:cobalamin biosynthesis protein CobT